MSIEYRKGDLLEQKDVNFIIHCANCFNTMGAGIARAIAEKYPEAVEADNQTKPGDPNKLGCFSYAKGKDGKIIANLYGQFDFGGGKRNLNYEAFYGGLEAIHNQILDSKDKKKVFVVGMPKFIGCGLANGSWRVVKAMLEDIFEESKIKLVICEL
jgi:O-acetyl-ADP-ribose deacetylase (regulator of RNase III)